MRDDIYLGESPSEEPCSQMSRDRYEEYYKQAKRECNALINQLRRQFGDEPFGATLFIKRNPHDFGTYLSVNCRFEDTIEEAVEYAYKLEENFPENWDDAAKLELVQDSVTAG